MGSDESHFSVSLIERDKATRQCPQTTGGSCELRIYKEEALDTKVSSVMASTTSLGRQFQSLIALGRKGRAPVLCS